MSEKTLSPTEAELKKALGSTYILWSEMIQAVLTISPVDTEWKPSKSEFGRMCLLRHKKRTLIYLTPEMNSITAAIVLGERAYRLAISSSLPDRIKQMLSQARPYAEGRGIRLTVVSHDDIPIIKELVVIKLTSVR